MAALLFLNNNSSFNEMNLGTGKGYSAKEI
jgi:UDP-glucose 4-epimerase